MDDRFARDLLVGSGYSQDDAARKLRDGLPVLLPARGDRSAITLTRVDGVWAERWTAGPGGKRVRVVSPEHGKSGDEHMGRTGWLLELDRSDGRAVVRFDGDPGPTKFTACSLQDLAEYGGARLPLSALRRSRHRMSPSNTAWQGGADGRAAATWPVVASRPAE